MPLRHGSHADAEPPCECLLRHPHCALQGARRPPRPDRDEDDRYRRPIVAVPPTRRTDLARHADSLLHTSDISALTGSDVMAADRRAHKAWVLAKALHV